jgi:hypothetical protein
MLSLYDTKTLERACMLLTVNAISNLTFILAISVALSQLLIYS